MLKRSPVAVPPQVISSGMMKCSMSMKVAAISSAHEDPVNRRERQAEAHPRKEKQEPR